MISFKNKESKIKKKKSISSFIYPNITRLKGFTMLELLLVMGIIGIMTGFFVTTFPASQARARDTRRKSDIKQYQVALESFANKNNGLYTSTLNSFWTLNTLCPFFGSTNCPLDPKDNQNICQGNEQCRYYYLSDGAGGATPTATRYVLFGALEKPTISDTAKVYFIVCSNGKAQESIIRPTDSTCP